MSRHEALGRVEREQLLDQLAGIRDLARQAELRMTRDRMCVAELLDGLDRKVIDQQALIARARRRHSGGSDRHLQAVG